MQHTHTTLQILHSFVKEHLSYSQMPSKNYLEHGIFEIDFRDLKIKGFKIYNSASTFLHLRGLRLLKNQTTLEESNLPHYTYSLGKNYHTNQAYNFHFNTIKSPYLFHTQDSMQDNFLLIIFDDIIEFDQLIMYGRTDAVFHRSNFLVCDAILEDGTHKTLFHYLNMLNHYSKNLFQLYNTTHQCDLNDHDIYQDYIKFFVYFENQTVNNYKAYQQLTHTNLDQTIINFYLTTLQPIHKQIFDKLDLISKDIKIEAIQTFFSYQLNKNLWYLWFQGFDQAPPLVKICMNSIQKYCYDFSIHFLTFDNLENYIELPSFIWDKYKKGLITNTHLSDIIRLYLLSKYGGLWVDATCLFTASIPEKFLSQPFFQFRIQETLPFTQQLNKKIFDIYSKKFTINKYHTGSSWFMYSEKNGAIMTLAKNFLTNFWKKYDNIIDYFLFHYILMYTVLNNKQCAFEYSQSICRSNRMPFLLKQYLHDKYDQETFNYICQLSFIHKLTYKYKEVKQNSFLAYILDHYN